MRTQRPAAAALAGALAACAGAPPAVPPSEPMKPVRLALRRPVILACGRSLEWLEGPGEGTAGEPAVLTLALSGLDFKLPVSGPSEPAWVYEHRFRLLEQGLDGPEPWLELAAESVDPEGPAGTPRPLSLRIPPRPGAASLGVFAEEPDGSTLSLAVDSHGHKRLLREDPGESPLLVRARFLRVPAGGRGEAVLLEEREFALQLSEGGKDWQWREFRFDVLSYEYDRSMELEVRRLPLSPDPAAEP